MPVGREEIPVKKKEMKRAGLPRLLAVLFALGVIAAALGLGAKTYLDRTLDTLAEEGVIRNESLADHPLRKALSEQEIKDYIRESFPVILQQDRAGLEAFVRKAQDLMIRNSPDDFRTYAMHDEAKYQNLLDRATAEILAKDEFTGGLKELVSKARQKLGLRWILLEAALHSREIMIAGAALAALSLLLWFILGGVSAGVVRGGLIPVLLVSAACAAAILLLAAKMAPASSQGIDIAEFIAKYI